MSEPTPRRWTYPDSEIVAVHPYTDNIEVARFSPLAREQGRPKCMPRHRAPDGQWYAGLGDVRSDSLPLYRQRGAFEALYAGDTLHICEGEGDSDAIFGAGGIATTNIGGALKFQQTHATILASLDSASRIIIIADTDENQRGEEHARDVLAKLLGAGINRERISVVQAAAGKDASDHLAAGLTLEDFVPLELPEPEPKKKAGKPARHAHVDPDELGDSEHLTDLGNARRLVNLFGDSLRYVESWKTWLIWSGVCWRRDATGEIMRYAKETVRFTYDEAGECESSDGRRAVATHALHSESQRSLRAMVELAKTEVGIAAEPGDFDADPWLLNTPNGTLDLQTGELRPHRSLDLLTRCTGALFDPDAESELFDAFLARVVPCERVREFLQRAVGYSLTGDTREEVFFFVHGPTASGKSTLMESLKNVLSGYAMTCDFETFLARRDVGGPRPDLARLVGSRLVASIEVSDGKRLAEGLVKTLVGGDTIAVRGLYAAEFEYRPQFKLWLAANDKPQVRDDDEALWRRVLMIPFDVAIPEEERDPEVKSALANPAEHGAAILAWAVRGCLDWQQKGLQVPDEVRAATAGYRREMDLVAEFIEDACVVTPAVWTSTGVLFDAYVAWTGKVSDPLNRRAFGKRLAAHGFVSEKSRHNRGWSGIGLRARGDVRDVSGADSVNPPYESEQENFRESTPQTSHMSPDRSEDDLGGFSDA